MLILIVQLWLILRLTMFKSIRSNRGLDLVLLRMKKQDLVLSNAEATLLDKLIDFLQPFADSTKQLEGELYVTMDLSVIIREQLYVHLEFKEDYHAVIKQAKALMLNKWDDRMPLQGLRVVAAYLNPALRNVKSIHDFIEAN